MRDVQDFRAASRRDEIPAGYRGRWHTAATFGGGTAALAGCLAMLDAVPPLEWLSVPIAFVYANLAEYLGHRYVMHRRRRGLGAIHHRHAGQHHRFFTAAAMSFEEARDLRAVLFPPLLVVFFFGGFALPAGLLLAWLVSANVAWLTLATGIGYFLSYEFLHLACHAPPHARIARLPGLAALRRLHTRHHDPACMAQCNVNITWPIGGWLFGTLDRGPR